MKVKKSGIRTVLELIQLFLSGYIIYCSFHMVYTVGCNFTLHACDCSGFSDYCQFVPVAFCPCEVINH